MIRPTAVFFPSADAIVSCHRRQRLSEICLERKDRKNVDKMHNNFKMESNSESKHAEIFRDVQNTAARICGHFKCPHSGQILDKYRHNLKDLLLYFEIDLAIWLKCRDLEPFWKAPIWSVFSSLSQGLDSTRDHRTTMSYSLNCLFGFFIFLETTMQTFNWVTSNLFAQTVLKSC